MMDESMRIEKWLDLLPESLEGFMDRLRPSEVPGRYYPCVEGRTRQGEQVALGFGCYALKVCYMMNWWPRLKPEEKSSWLEFIKDFQVEGNPIQTPVGESAFIDWPVFRYLERKTPWWLKWGRRFWRSAELLYHEKVVVADTKQAISTLAEVGAESHRPFRGFPTDREGLRAYLDRFDWSRPWAAGAHYATIAVFLASEAPRFLNAAEIAELKREAERFISEKVDPESGSYFKGPRPNPHMLVNGAMKVLSGLDWLEIPIQEPEKLIDTCLAMQPLQEGCHLVNAVYVLYRCGQRTEHRRREIGDYCRNILAMIERHYVAPDGGFSYSIGKSQTSYYGVPISKGLPVADIHGTVLLLWALIMILEILELNRQNWKVIKP